MGRNRVRNLRTNVDDVDVDVDVVVVVVENLRRVPSMVLPVKAARRHVGGSRVVVARVSVGYGEGNWVLDDSRLSCVGR